MRVNRLLCIFQFQVGAALVSLHTFVLPRMVMSSILDTHRLADTYTVTYRCMSVKHKVGPIDKKVLMSKPRFKYKKNGLSQNSYTKSFIVCKLVLGDTAYQTVMLNGV